MSQVESLPVCVCVNTDFIPLGKGDLQRFSVSFPDTVLHASHRLAVNLMHQDDGATNHLSRWDVVPRKSENDVAFEWMGQGKGIQFHFAGKIVAPKWTQWHLLPDHGVLVVRIRILSADNEETLFRQDIAMPLQRTVPPLMSKGSHAPHGPVPIVRLVAINAFRRDAIGNFLFSCAKIIRSAGFAVQIYAAGFDPLTSGIAGEVRHISRLFEDISPGDGLFYHASGYDAFLPHICGLSVPKAFYYHNITPASFFSRCAPQTAAQLEESLSQLALVEHFDMVAANSHSSIMEFSKNAGKAMSDTHVIPPVTTEQLSRFVSSVRASSSTSCQPPYLLYVGQLAPHKQVYKLFHLLAALHEQGEDVRLVVVGQSPYPAYQDYLNTVINSLPSGTAQRIILPGVVDNDELASLYKHAKCFVTFSAHEGFCVPLIEAMVSGIPVFSKDIPACRETLGSAGVLLSDASPEEQARRMIRIWKDGEILASIQRKAAARAARILRSADGESVIELVHTLLSRPCASYQEPDKLLKNNHTGTTVPRQPDFDFFSHLDEPHDKGPREALQLTRRLYLHWLLWPYFQQNFDLSTRKGRNDYLYWWLISGRTRFEWNPFVSQQGKGYWKQPVDEVAHLRAKPITRLLYLAWWGREDMHGNYPLETEQDCEKLVRWYMQWGMPRLKLPPHMVLCLEYWDAPESIKKAGSPLTRLERLFWETREEIRTQFTCGTPRECITYKTWFAEHRDELLNAIPEQAEVEPGPPRICAAGEFVSGGINLIGFAKGELGIGEDVRMAADAMDDAHIPYAVLDAPLDISSRCGNAYLEQQIVASPRYAANLIYMPCVETLRLFLGKGGPFFPGRFTIGAWQWELARRPAEWQPIFNLVQEVWAPTRFIAAAMEENSPVPVRYMPMAVDVKEVEQCERHEFGLPEESFLFIFMFDANSRYGRKNPFAVIEAFKRAFPAKDDNVGLVVKAMYSKEDSPDWKELLDAVGDDPRIHIINATLSAKRVLGLLQCCDALVSLHRAEGFGRTMAEALLLGKSVVASGYSGNMDFTTPETAFLVEGKEVPVPEGAYPFPKGQMWFEADVEHAAWQMQQCASDAELGRTRALLGQELILREFSPKAVGVRYAKRLRELGILEG